MSSKKPDYQCIRCGYETNQKNCMRTHLYKNLKTCPAVLNKIELTEEIKQDIMDNRIHKLINENNTTKIINNYNMVNNFISNVDLFKKLNSALEYNKKETINYGDQIEASNIKKIHKLEHNEYKYGFKIDNDDITDMIDKSTTLKKDSIEELNVLFLDKLNKIALYHDDEWQEFRAEKGIQQLVRINQTYFLETYEIYILKRLYQDDHLDARWRNKYREQLKNYYTYLVIFDLMPYAYQKENSEIVDSGPFYNLDNKNYIQEQSMVVYNEAKKELKKSESNKYRKIVTDLVKRNNQANLKQLNETLASIINMDEQFKNSFFKEFGKKVIG